MIISVINLTVGAVTDAELHRAVRAVNRQIEQDFEPYWSFGAQLRVEGKTGRRKGQVDPADMRGDAILYLRGKTDVDDAEGYHDRHFSGIPYGFVFLELSRKLKEPWTVTLSHEALELIGDPEANLLVQGPHPEHPGRKVFHWFEMCDAVQAESYAIDGIGVSNFVLPLFFTSGDEHGGRNDFLGTIKRGKSLQSFSANPGGYIGFFDPTAGAHGDDVTWFAKNDRLSAQRLAIKQKLGTGRGNLRRKRSQA
jgi:hypothetical protein